MKTVGELRYSGCVSSSWSTRDTRRVNLVTNMVISHEWGMTLGIEEYSYFIVHAVSSKDRYHDCHDAKHFTEHKIWEGVFSNRVCK